MIITLKDGSSKEYENGKTVLEIAKDLSEGLARVTLGAIVDGKVVEANTVLDRDWIPKAERYTAIPARTFSHRR